MLFRSAFFAGVDLALDALHGAQRRHADIASDVGGLALWQVLCPGVFSFAAGALAGCLAGGPLSAKRSDNTSHQESPP